jgi:transcription elongation GreA/GreB family factor
LAENSEYDEAKNEQGKLYSGLPNWSISSATAPTLIDESSIEPDVVTTAAESRLKMMVTGDREEYQIVRFRKQTLRKAGFQTSRRLKGAYRQAR